MSINSKMTSLADAIRAKSGVSGKLTIAEMTDAVDGIELGGSGGSTIEYGYINADGKVQKLDLSGDAPVNSGDAELMAIHSFLTGQPEPDYGGGGSGSGTFDLAKVTEYTPYAPAMTAITAVSVSGMGSFGDEEDFSAANGIYNVTAETAGETDWKKRIYRHETEEYYLFYYVDADYPEDAYWQFGTDTDSGFLTLYSTENISSGVNDWENWDWGETFTLTTTVTETTIPEVPMVLKGVLATGYADGEWSFDTVEKSFAGFNKEYAVGYVYFIDGNSIIGNKIIFADGIEPWSSPKNLKSNTYDDDFIVDQSTVYDDNTLAYQAFDGTVNLGNFNSGTYNSRDYVETAWISVKLSQPRPVNFLKIVSAGYNNGCQPASFSFEYSDDGMIWTPCFEVSGLTQTWWNTPKIGTVHEWSFNITAPHYYYRLNMTSLTSGVSYNIQQMEFGYSV